MINFLFSLKEIQSGVADNESDIYGFKKTIVALTDFGKIYGLSSYDGKVLWKSVYINEKVKKILIR